VPIPPAGPDGVTLIVQVRLRRGENRFYAMASRSGGGSIDGRTSEVAVRCDAPEPPGRTHVLALGVSRYTRHALQFADRDAKRIAAFLHEHELASQDDESPRRGLSLVLTDEQVTNESVDDAFTKLRDSVAGHPEDVVVVFLAGHADVVQDR